MWTLAGTWCVPYGSTLYGAACSALFPADGIVTLTATADANSTFAGWNKYCSGVAATCTVTMSDVKMAVIAKFNKRR